MREWRRVPADTLCGNCPNVIPADESAIYIKLPNVKRELVRCQNCVGLAPPDLPQRPPRVEPQGFTKPMSKLKRTAMGYTRERVESALAATARMLGERE